MTRSATQEEPLTTLSERFGRTTNRLYPHVTHDAAAELSRAPAETDFGGLEGHRYCAVVSYKRDGSPVSTPVWFGHGDDGRIYFRTLEKSYKLRRIARRADVLIAPCDPRGKPVGPPARGRARILPPAEEDVAERAIQSNFGLVRRAYKRAIGDAPARYIEVVAGAAGSPSEETA
jgi:PPOX class probable F420-dependent enzyme